jgi:acyl carrier protein
MNTQRQDIRSYVIEAFLFGQDHGLTDDSSFLEQGILDSTGVLELVTHIEATYGVTVNDDELLPDNLDSISAISDFVDRKRLLLVPSAA